MLFRFVVRLIAFTSIALVMTEFFLRIIPSGFQYPRRLQYSNEDGIGVVLGKNLRIKYRNACTGNTVFSTNRFGMRDPERAIEKQGKRIAFLGDSIVEAAQVNDADVVSRLLEKELGHDVLNFGIGGVGTVQERLLYENKVRTFAPDVVVLFFNTDNDVSDNSLSLAHIIYPGKSFLTFRDEEGAPYSEISYTRLKTAKQYLLNHFAFFRLIQQRISSVKT